MHCNISTFCFDISNSSLVTHHLLPSFPVSILLDSSINNHPMQICYNGKKVHKVEITCPAMFNPSKMVKACFLTQTSLFFFLATFHRCYSHTR